MKASRIFLVIFLSGIFWLVIAQFFFCTRFQFKQEASAFKGNIIYNPYANINADTKTKTMKGSIKKIIHNGVEIQHLIGYEFLKFILDNDTDFIINYVKDTIDKYI